MLLLRFDLDGQGYALQGQMIEEMLPLLPVEPVPLASASMLGLINWRNRSVPLFDLCSMLLGRPCVETMLTRIAIMHLSKDLLIGLRIENLTGTLKVNEKDLADPLAGMDITPWLGRVYNKDTESIQLIEVDRLADLMQSPQIPSQRA